MFDKYKLENIDFLIVIKIVSPVVFAYALGRHKNSFEVSTSCTKSNKYHVFFNGTLCQNSLKFVAFLGYTRTWLFEHRTFLIKLPSIVTELLSVPCVVSSSFYFSESLYCFKVHLDFFPPGHLSVSLLEYLDHFLCCSICLPHYFPSICKKTVTAIF